MYFKRLVLLHWHNNMLKIDHKLTVVLIWVFIRNLCKMIVVKISVSTCVLHSWLLKSVAALLMYVLLSQSLLHKILIICKQKTKTLLLIWEWVFRRNFLKMTVVIEFSKYLCTYCITGCFLMASCVTPSLISYLIPYQLLEVLVSNSVELV